MQRENNKNEKWIVRVPMSCEKALSLKNMCTCYPKRGGKIGRGDKKDYLKK